MFYVPRGYLALVISIDRVKTVIAGDGHIEVFYIGRSGADVRGGEQRDVRKIFRDMPVW